MNLNNIMMDSFNDEMSKIAQGYPTYQDYQPEPKQGGGWMAPAAVAAGLGAGVYAAHKYMRPNSKPSLFGRIAKFARNPIVGVGALALGAGGVGLAKGLGKSFLLRDAAKSFFGKNYDTAVSGGIELPSFAKKWMRKNFGSRSQESWTKRESLSKKWKQREDDVAAGKVLGRQQRHAERKRGAAATNSTSQPMSSGATYKAQSAPGFNPPKGFSPPSVTQRSSQLTAFNSASVSPVMQGRPLNSVYIDQAKNLSYNPTRQIPYNTTKQLGYSPKTKQITHNPVRQLPYRKG